MNDKQARKFLKEYSLGELEAITLLQGQGDQAISYLLKTSEGEFVLTLYPDTQGEEYLLSIFDFLTLLQKETGLNLPTAIIGKNGKALNMTGDQLAAIFPRLRGEPSSGMNEEQMQQVGITMGLMHRFGREFSLNASISSLQRGVCQMMLDSRSRLSADGIFSPQELLEEMKLLRKSLSNELSWGVIHNDFSPRNLLFSNNLLTGIVDFYHICRGPLLWDLAWVMTRCCFDTNQESREFQPNLAKALIDSYLAVVPISAEEFSHFHQICRSSCFHWLLYKYWLFSKRATSGREKAVRRAQSTYNFFRSTESLQCLDIV